MIATTTLDEAPGKGDALDRLCRGALSGAVGGAVGGAAKLLGELVFPPRAPGEPVPPVVLVSKIVQALSGSPLLPEREALATQLFHWSFSLGAGATYGALVEIFPRLKLGRGVGFGLVLCLLTHESMLPLLRLSLPLSQIPFTEHVSELLTHALFGVGVEEVRRVVRRRVLDAHPAREPSPPRARS